MRIRRRDKGVPELNTTSTADISFMLLIFFLVTSSMYEAKGLLGQLPPKDKDNDKKEIIVDKENVMAITLDADGKLMVNDSLCEMSALKGQMEEFIMRRGKEHLLTIDASPECRYEPYFHLQQIIGEAYKEAREMKAQKDYGRGLAELTSIDHDKVITSLPQRIAENFHDAPVSDVSPSAPSAATVPESTTVPEASPSGKKKGGRP